MLRYVLRPHHQLILLFRTYFTIYSETIVSSIDHRDQSFSILLEGDNLSPKEKWMCCLFLARLRVSDFSLVFETSLALTCSK